MSQRPLRIDAIPDQLLDFPGFRETLRLFARKNQFIVETDIEYAAAAGYQTDPLQIMLERGQQFLRHPCRTQEPAALRAILDLQLMF